MNSKTWIINKLQENEMNRKSVVDLYEDYKKEFNTNLQKDSFRRSIYKIYEEINGGIDPDDYDTDSVLRIEASKQKLADVNGQLRKTNREQYRIYNSLEEIFTEYVSILKSTDLSKFKIKQQEQKENNKILVVQLSDLHGNEIIEAEEANGNIYDFDIFSKRLKKFITRVLQTAKQEKVSEVYLFLTGDLINSSRRLSEKLAQCTSLVRASLLTTFLLQQAIIEIGKYFPISVASVSGNESRIQDEWDSSSIGLSENWDYLIFQNLKLIFSSTNVKFVENKNNSQNVVQLPNGFNALLIHGNQLRSSSIDSDIAKILQSYLYQGIPIHGVFYGHYHSAHCGDIISRSSSMCGGNAYSNNDLKFLSRASQNVYIINQDLGYDALKVDLQNTNGIEGYDIKDELERYNIRSANSNVRVTIENIV